NLIVTGLQELEWSERVFDGIRGDLKPGRVVRRAIEPDQGDREQGQRQCRFYKGLVAGALIGHGVQSVFADRDIRRDRAHSPGRELWRPSPVRSLRGPVPPEQEDNMS